MKQRIRALLILLLLAQTACKEEEIAEPEAPPSFHFENLESVAFADFLKAAALVSQWNRVAFHHPELPGPVYFTSRQIDCADPLDPIVLHLTADQVIYDSKPLDEAALRKWALSLVQQAKIIDEPPRLTIAAAEKPPVSFGSGLSVLRILIENGINQVTLPSPIGLEERAAQNRKRLELRPSPPRPPRGQ